MTYSGISDVHSFAAGAQDLWHDYGGALGWDVGANWGQCLPKLLNICYQVIAFEPATESWPMLRTNWGSNARVQLEFHALGADIGCVELSERELALQFGQLVALRMPDKGTIPWGRELQRRIVPCVTADTYARCYGTPDFAKVDTEGGEIDFLNGAVELMRLGRTDFLIEFHSDVNGTQCDHTLARFGYKTEVVRYPNYPENSPLWTQHGWIRAAAPNGRIRSDNDH